MEVEELRGKVGRLTDECQERSDQANEWYKALQVHTCMEKVDFCLERDSNPQSLQLTGLAPVIGRSWVQIPAGS